MQQIVKLKLINKVKSNKFPKLTLMMAILN